MPPFAATKMDLDPMRKPIIAGNWKMYKTVQQTCAFFEQIKPLVSGSTHCDIVVCPTFVNLKSAVDHTAGTNIQIGGQNLYWAKEGAFTGEISADMLTAVGCRWVLIGHSERRQFFGETDATVGKKIGPALEAGPNPIVCIGESLAERNTATRLACSRRNSRMASRPLARRSSRGSSLRTSRYGRSVQERRPLRKSPPTRTGQSAVWCSRPSARKPHLPAAFYTAVA